MTESTKPLDDELGGALRVELLAWPGVQARKMMGTLSFFRGKQMLGCYVNRELFKKAPPKWANRAGEPPYVCVRLDAEQKKRALRRAGVTEPRMKMKNWIEISLDSRDALAEAVRWLGTAYESAAPPGKPRHARRKPGRK